MVGRRLVIHLGETLQVTGGAGAGNSRAMSIRRDQRQPGAPGAVADRTSLVRRDMRASRFASSSRTVMATHTGFTRYLCYIMCKFGRSERRRGVAQVARIRGRNMRTARRLVCLVLNTQGPVGSTVTRQTLPSCPRMVHRPRGEATIALVAGVALTIRQNVSRPGRFAFCNPPVVAT